MFYIPADSGCQPVLTSALNSPNVSPSLDNILASADMDGKDTMMRLLSSSAAGFRMLSKFAYQHKQRCNFYMSFIKRDLYTQSSVIHSTPKGPQLGILSKGVQ